MRVHAPVHTCSHTEPGAHADSHVSIRPHRLLFWSSGGLESLFNSASQFGFAPQPSGCVLRFYSSFSAPPFFLVQFLSTEMVPPQGC